MGVKGVGGGGRKGGAGGAKGAAPAGKGGFGNKVDKSESLVKASGWVSGSNVSGPSVAQAGAANATTTTAALNISRMLKAGQIKSKEEATRKLVADILRDKLQSKSKTLANAVMQAVDHDPRLEQMFERLWNRAEEAEE